MHSPYSTWSPKLNSSVAHLSQRKNCYPYCQSFCPSYISNFSECQSRICSFLALNPQNIQIKQSRNVTIIRGENIEQGKIILSKSISPYTKKIIIRYESPKNRKIGSENNANILPYNNINMQPSEAIRPKILDRKKAAHKPERPRISFKSVKSASTDLFFETPIKKMTKCDRNGSTDETQSRKSLSRVSIDQRYFQQ